MRTKSLLFTAALSAIGLSGVVGQTFSVNVVGYITIDAPKGLSIIANQLDNKTGNFLKDVIPALPDGSTVHFFTGSNYHSIGYFGGYDPDGATTALTPGIGAFLDIPLDATDAARKLVLVGEVPQKAASNISIPNGLSFVSSATPRAGKVTTDLKFPTTAALDGAFFYKYNNAIKNYETFGIFGGAWDGAEPSVAVGEGFFFLNTSGAAQPWNQDFEVK